MYYLGALIVLLLLVCVALLLRLTSKVEQSAPFARKVWVQLSNVLSMLMLAGFKRKRPRDWNDDFSKTHIVKDDEIE